VNCFLKYSQVNFLKYFEFVYSIQQFRQELILYIAAWAHIAYFFVIFFCSLFTK